MGLRIVISTGQVQWTWNRNGAASKAQVETVGSGLDIMNLANRPIVYEPDDETDVGCLCEVKLGLMDAHNLIDPRGVLCSTCLLPEPNTQPCCNTCYSLVFDPIDGSQTVRLQLTQRSYQPLITNPTTGQRYYYCGWGNNTFGQQYGFELWRNIDFGGPLVWGMLQFSGYFSGVDSFVNYFLKDSGQLSCTRPASFDGVHVDYDAPLVYDYNCHSPLVWSFVGDGVDGCFRFVVGCMSSSSSSSSSGAPFCPFWPDVLTLNPIPCTAPEWEVNTAYSAGMIITGATGLYSCVVSGTSGALSMPSGQGQDIIDGTAHWRFI